MLVPGAVERQHRLSYLVVSQALVSFPGVLLLMHTAFALALPGLAWPPLGQPQWIVMLHLISFHWSGSVLEALGLPGLLRCCRRCLVCTFGFCSFH